MRARWGVGLLGGRTTKGGFGGTSIPLVGFSVSHEQGYTARRVAEEALNDMRHAGSSDSSRNC